MKVCILCQNDVIEIKQDFEVEQLPEPINQEPPVLPKLLFLIVGQKFEVKIPENIEYVDYIAKPKLDNLIVFDQETS